MNEGERIKRLWEVEERWGFFLLPLLLGRLRGWGESGVPFCSPQGFSHPFKSHVTRAAQKSKKAILPHPSPPGFPPGSKKNQSKTK